LADFLDQFVAQKEKVIEVQDPAYCQVILDTVDTVLSLCLSYFKGSSMEGLGAET
jgi:hypothetical protein